MFAGLLRPVRATVLRPQRAGDAPGHSRGAGSWAGPLALAERNAKWGPKWASSSAATKAGGGHNKERATVARAASDELEGDLPA